MCEEDEVKLDRWCHATGRKDCQKEKFLNFPRGWSVQYTIFLASQHISWL